MIIEGPVLVIAPHPDDDVLGCAGLILTALATTSVRVLYLTSGELGATGIEPAIVLEWRERDARAAADVLGVSSIAFLEQPDGSLAVTPELIGLIADDIAFHRPRTILVPHCDEEHPDHRAAYHLLRMMREDDMPQLRGVDVLTYEVWTPMPRFAYALDISDHIWTKIEAIRKHESQVSRVKFDEAILALNRFRGELHNRPKGPFAEVYGRMP